MRKPRVLLVDGEEEYLNVLSAELEGKGYRTSVASDGGKAKEILGKETFGLILLDIKIPGLDGFEVLKHSKKHYPKTKVIILTGFADLCNAIESKKFGSDDFVSKPYDLEDLVTIIKRVCSC